MKANVLGVMIACAAALCGSGAGGAEAATIAYQGHIAADGAAFTGTGLFKFALVSPGGETLWSNDGSSAAGAEPVHAVSLPVDNGLYGVGLGDASIPNMTAIPPSAFTRADLRLRVWFSDGVHGFQLLSPDSRISSSPRSLYGADRPATLVVAKDGGNYADIPNAVAALPPGGGSVFVREGTYDVSATILLPSNVTLRGAGPSTVIRLADNVNAHVIANADPRHGNSSIVVADLAVDGNKAHNAGGISGVYLMRVTGSAVRNCRIHDCAATGIYLGGSESDDNLVSGNNVFSNAFAGFHCSAGDFNRVIGNRFVGNGDAGMRFTGNSPASSLVSANLCMNNGNGGIYLAGADAGAFSGNICMVNTLDGIMAYGDEATTSAYNSFFGNLCRGNERFGIIVTNPACTGNVAMGNSLHGNDGPISPAGGSETIWRTNAGDAYNQY